jgi:uncharacterized membrane protein YeaQ/YmgE (transglycosylase-associated protein family)
MSKKFAILLILLLAIVGIIATAITHKGSTIFPALLTGVIAAAILSLLQYFKVSNPAAGLTSTVVLPVLVHSQINPASTHEYWISCIQFYSSFFAVYLAGSMVLKTGIFNKTQIQSQPLQDAKSKSLA